MSYGKLLLEARRKEIESQKLEACKKPKNKLSSIAKDIQDKKDKVCKKKKSYRESVSDLKKSLLSECIYNILENSLPKRPICESNDLNIIKRNMINTFIEENGLVYLLNEYKHKSYLLSEFVRIIEETTDMAILEAKKVDKENPNINLSNEIKDNFYNQIKSDDIDELCETIRQRVMNGIETFKINNANDKHDIQQAIQQTNEKCKDKSEKVQEACKTQAKKKVSEIKNRKKKTVFESMVYNIARSSTSNEAMKERFFTESGINMESIIEMTEVMYTFLEVLNTAKFANINESYIQKILKSQM